MQRVLEQLNGTPGIVGSLLCDRAGNLMARAFPPLFDEKLLAETAVELVEGASALEFGGGGMEAIDLRYAEGRILVKPLPDSFLLLLCVKGSNRQLVSLSLGMAAAKLAGMPVPAPAPATATATEGAFLLAVDPLNRSAHTFWEQMHEHAAISRETARRFSETYRMGSFRRVRLTNRENGKSIVMPTRVIEGEERRMEGKVVLSRAALERLEAAVGGQLLAEPATGTGLFGWEGI